MHSVIGAAVCATAAAVPVVAVMGLHKLTAGDGYSYLTRQVAAHDATEKGHASLGDYYAERGESPGRWLGSGLAGLGLRPGEAVTAEQMKALFGEGRHPNAVALEAAAAARGATARQVAAAGALGRPFLVYDAASTFNTQVARAFTAHNRDNGAAWNAAIPVEVRAQIRTEVGHRMFAEQHGRPPLDARELSGFVARASRQATSAVAGYDLTFSPVKSVSVLWALAPAPVADQVRAAHQAAVAYTLRWLEREAAFTRVGRGGARQVATRGLVAVGFTHRDSRAGDPDLHTHVAISNKVQVLEPTGGGRWLAVDGRLLYQANIAASERYNTRLEAELTVRLSVRFHDSPTPTGKRPVREIDGINTLLTRWWSRRRRMIEARRSELAAEFQTRHGRPPTAVESIALAQRATLETRAVKHAPVSEAEQRKAWRREADQVLGGPVEVDDMLTRALRGRATPGDRPDRPWVRAAAQATVAAVEASRATWQVWHLRAEAERRSRAAGVGLPDLEEAVDRVVAEAQARSVRLGFPDPVSEPPRLRRADGVSVYDVHGSTWFTSMRILSAEQQLLEATRLHGGRRLTDVRVAIAVAESAAEGCELTAAQTTMVRDLATSGSLLQLAVAPAGTGKTTAMRVLSHAWATSGGEVLGLAPSAQAAHELGHATGGRTDTLTKLTWTLAHAPRNRWPTWVDAIGPRTLVIIDEGGQAGTVELATAVAFITRRGGSVRLIGDDQQLAAVGAGGILRDIQQTVGAATLSEVRRFHDPAEAAATLAVRDGDPSALGFYADNARLHVGDLGAATTHAYDAWASDRAAGLDAILLAPNRDLVTSLNVRARTDRLHALPPADRGDEVALADGSRASVGDLIVTRRNDRRLTLSATCWVKNGDRWTVTRVHPDHSITARHLNLGRSLRIPADYVAESVQLGYAATVHAAQGMTTDTAHTLVTGDEARQLLYVALSRGRRANHLYLATGHDGDPHSLIRPESLLPPTAIDTLTGILQRDGSPPSATTTQRQLGSPGTQLHEAAVRYHDALGFAAEQTMGAARLHALDAQVDALWPGLTHQPAYPTLRAHLALQALDGTDPVSLLLDAAQSGQLDSSHDPAAVLDWRLHKHPDRRIATGPLPWLPPIPGQLLTDTLWGPYLDVRATRVTSLALTVHEEACAWSADTMPSWTAGLTSTSHAGLRGDLAIWRAAFGIPDTDIRATGPNQPAHHAATHQRELIRRAEQATGALRPGTGTGTDKALREALPRCVQTDPQCGRLTQRLGALTDAGIAVTDLLNQALAQPRPLPDEHAADALWWRLVRHLEPADLPTADSPGGKQRPPWVSALTARVGNETAERIVTDADWPAFVAAIQARPTDWTPEQPIDAITDRRWQDAVAEDLCSTLVWRIATGTDPANEPDDIQPPAAPATAQLPPEMTAVCLEPARATSVNRIVELNKWALQHYTQLYPSSWAPDYLRERLGTDLAHDRRFTVGYASPGPVTLTRRLTGRGATERELIDAGLAQRTDTGRVIDTFRDRLVFPIYAGLDLVGFIGRRNPHKDSAVDACPKYLNTRTTAAFTKGELLFGLTESAAALESDATPVLVEGPLDAIAVTLAGRGRSVGIAPLGTAFTDNQAAQLKPRFRNHPARIVIATDPDTAGWSAAQQAFWRLASLGADPRHLALPDGMDPVDVIRARGSHGLGRLLEGTHKFGTDLLRHLISTADLNDAAALLWLARDAAKIIAALPPDQWTTHIDQLTQQLDLPPGMLHLDVIDRAQAWSHDPSREANHQIRMLTTQWSPPIRQRDHHLPTTPPPLTSPSPTRHAPNPTAPSGRPLGIRR